MRVKLEDICEILDNRRIPITANKRVKGIYPYYGANGIQDYVDDFIFDDELVLLAEDGGNFGSKEKPIAYRVSGKCWVNNHAHVLKPKKGTDVDYLCYSLMYYDVSNLVNGATRQKLTQTDMRKMIIPFPSFEEQKKIAAVLDKVCDLIALRRKQLERLDLMVKARFVEMFGDPLDESVKQLTMPMTDLCDIIDGDRGKMYPKSDEFEKKGFCLFLNAKNVTEKGFCFDSCFFVTEKKDKELRKGKLLRGDIVLTTRGTIGNLALYDEAVPFEHIRINSGMAILRLRKDIILETFFIKQFRMLLNMIKEKIVSGSAQPQLPISTMNKIRMIVPDIKAQQTFSTFVAEIDKLKLPIQRSLDTLEVLKKSLMQEYFG